MSAAKPTAAQWIVTISGDCAVADVALALKKAGFAVGEVMAEIGVISGRCAEAKLATLRKLPGVADIAPDGPVDIGPPGSPDTW